MATVNDPSTTSRPTARWLGLSAPVAFASVGDPDGTRTVTSIVALLAALGIGLLMLGIWLFRVTRPDPELLAPLETMGERKWRRADPVWQRRRLDEVRPPGAEPLQPSVAPPDLDEAFDRGPLVEGFDDLHDDALFSIPGDPLVAGSIADPTSGMNRSGGDRGVASPYQPSAIMRDPVRVRLVAAGSTTPTGIERPTPDDLPASDLDPAAIEAAIAELDAELAHPGEPRTGDRTDQSAGD